MSADNKSDKLPREDTEEESRGGRLRLGRREERRSGGCRRWGCGCRGLASPTPTAPLQAHAPGSHRQLQKLLGADPQGAEAPPWPCTCPRLHVHPSSHAGPPTNEMARRPRVQNPAGHAGSPGLSLCVPPKSTALHTACMLPPSFRHDPSNPSVRSLSVSPF